MSAFYTLGALTLEKESKDWVLKCSRYLGESEKSESQDDGLALELGHDLRELRLWSTYDLNTYDDCIIADYSIDPDQKLQFRIETVPAWSSKEVDVYKVAWRSTDPEIELMDAIRLGSGHWYGMGEMFNPEWPLEKKSYSDVAFVNEDYLKTKTIGGILERYWINSQGFAITVDDHVPLWLTWNQGDFSGKMALTAKRSGIYSNFVPSDADWPVQLTYWIWCSKPRTELKDLHLAVIQHYFGSPESLPDLSLFRNPIWSSWAYAYTHTNETNMREFCDGIISNKFTCSILGLDDGWGLEHGDLEFNSEKFPDSKGFVDWIKERLGCRVILWVHLFLNKTAKVITEDSNKYKELVIQMDGEPIETKWWNGNGYVVDVTNQKAAEWIIARLHQYAVASHIDGFKFDAGEITYLPENFCSNPEFSYPAEFCRKYASLAEKMNKQLGCSCNEVRVSNKSQSLGLLTRLSDLDSHWGRENGLKSLIPNALYVSLMGYPFILPDMIGGNGYGGKRPDRELFIRWVQVSTLMPFLQFSIPPWHYDQWIVEACLEMMKLRSSFVDLLISLGESSRTSGEPIIRPIWWLDDANDDVLTCDSEFLIGNDLLVAPIIEPGVSGRTVVLPKGLWKASIDGFHHLGPGTIFQVAKLDELPLFHRQ